MFPDMTIELFRPNGTSAVLLVMKHVSVFPGPGVFEQVTGVNVCLHVSLSGDPREGAEGDCCDAFTVHRQNRRSGIQRKCLQRGRKGERSKSTEREP